MSKEILHNYIYVVVVRFQGMRIFTGVNAVYKANDYAKKCRKSGSVSLYQVGHFQGKLNPRKLKVD